MNIEANTTKTKARGLIPDYVVDSVFNIDFRGLQTLGIRCLVLDVDHTLVSYRVHVLDDTMRDFLLDQKSRGYIEKIFLASNSTRNLNAIADSIGASVMQPHFARKPAGAYFKKLQRMLEYRPQEVVMVGDKLLTDILGGNRAGFVTVLVTPIGPDRLFDRLLMRRIWSQLYLKRYKK